MNSTMTTTPWEQVRQESLAAMTDTEKAEYDAAAIEVEARLQLVERVYNARMAAGIPRPRRKRPACVTSADEDTRLTEGERLLRCSVLSAYGCPGRGVES